MQKLLFDMFKKGLDGLLSMLSAC
uniref:Uncharacterized protein n=1 Tax=Rhizophora mucronata TaxID=61149 RepID=A0A2P2QFL9_RHIMU